MVEQATSWVKQNATLVYFLIAQAIALASGLTYIVNWKSDLESRVHILEVRGSPHLAEINNRLTVTEKETQANTARIESGLDRVDYRVNRIVEILTRELGKTPQQLQQPNR
jgi:hypothetical protein